MESYRLTQDAQNDLIRIHHYGVRTFGEIKADKYYLNFFEQFELIAEQPHLYQSIDDIRHGYRQCVCGIDTIYYRIVDDCVEIMNILGRQNHDEWL